MPARRRVGASARWRRARHSRGRLITGARTGMALHAPVAAATAAGSLRRLILAVCAHGPPPWVPRAPAPARRRALARARGAARRRGRGAADRCLELQRAREARLRVHEERGARGGVARGATRLAQNEHTQIINARAAYIIINKINHAIKLQCFGERRGDKTNEHPPFWERSTGLEDGAAFPGEGDVAAVHGDSSSVWSQKDVPASMPDTAQFFLRVVEPGCWHHTP